MTISITIHLSPSEEARLSIEATQNGIEPADLIARLLRQHLNSERTVLDEVTVKLRQWQAETETELLSSPSIHELFARWDDEDASKTQEELAADEHVWREFQQGIDNEREQASMRKLFNG